jgi:uncharacterized protein
MEEVFERLGVSEAQIGSFCAKWDIVRLEVFGSVLRPDFRPDSDIDLLVTFADGIRPGLRDYLDMEEELKALFRRNVDLIKRVLVEESPNWIRRRAILDSARELYAA